MKDTAKKDELIYSVRDIFCSLPESYFDIPDYQRGYKWTEDNIKALLEDIWSFKLEDNNDSFYCLQNITIIEKIDSEGVLSTRVIDGQQRLTTLYILLCYLGEIDLIKGKLSYSIRKQTKEYLKEDVLTRKCFESNYYHTAIHQDEYYIHSAASTIKKWFEEDKNLSETEKNTFKDKLLHHTKIIVNKVNGDEYQTFSNLNGAKVPLDAADLIRAMLITYTVKQWKSAFASDSYRIRMGSEIDEMGVFWADKNVRKFFEQFLPENVVRSDSDSQFNIDKYPIDILYILFAISKGYKSLNLQTYENILRSQTLDPKTAYDDLRSFYWDLVNWYTDNRIYHYLGYLMFHYKAQNPFIDIWDCWATAINKKDFVKELKKRIVNGLTKIEKTEDEKRRKLPNRDILLSRIRDFNVTNWYAFDKLNDILILCDVLIYLQTKSLNDRLPVDYFRAHNEDKEHIGCRTPNEKEMNQLDKWREDFKYMLETKMVDSATIETLLSRLSGAEVIDDDLRKEIIGRLTTFGINSIGNIVLLNLGVNRGYGNEPYAGKRKAIINNFFNEPNSEKNRDKKALRTRGAYIRPHTLRSFIKEGVDSWGSKNIKDNAEQIAHLIESFINSSDTNGE